MAPRGPRLGPGAEFDLIRAFLAGDPALPEDVRVGPGDDAAVLDGGLVVSTDLSLEGVHFRLDWISLEEAGYRAAASALSDLAAMAAEPLGVLVSLAVPQGRGSEAEAMHRGIRAAAADAGTAVVGGDVTRSPGPWVVDAAVLGRSRWPVLRSGARPGDELWVTGTLGGAAAAVRLWRQGRAVPDALRRRFVRPEPRIGAACCLAERGDVHALIDLSDGLAGDAAHLAAASRVRIVLRAPSLPVDPAVGEALGEASREVALHGGEDYELCFAAPPGAVDPGAFEERFGLALTRVGRVEAGSGVWLEDGGEPVPLRRGGFDHLVPPPPEGAAP